MSMGHRVIFVTGKSSWIPEGADVIETVSAADMHDAVMANYKEADIIIGAAAVGDFTAPKAVLKIKRKGPMTLELHPTADILAHVGEKKGKRVLVGFAAESGSDIKPSLGKIKSKNLDLLVFNDISKKGSGFASDTNEITVISKTGRKVFQGYGLKEALAREIISLAMKAGKK
jgi:phosphopantothenoylcysteine decarboxylase/phosphopantothenate--cysteine ligase